MKEISKSILGFKKYDGLTFNDQKNHYSNLVHNTIRRNNEEDIQPEKP